MWSGRDLPELTGEVRPPSGCPPGRVAADTDFTETGTRNSICECHGRTVEVTRHLPWSSRTMRWLALRGLPCAAGETFLVLATSRLAESLYEALGRSRRGASLEFHTLLRMAH